MRPKDEILIDIIEASEDYRAVVDVAHYIMVDYDTDAPGVPEVLMDMRDHLYSLYKEMLAVHKAEKGTIDI